jgi:hypothetical protein
MGMSSFTSKYDFKIKNMNTHQGRSRGSSVSIVSDYRLDNQCSIPGRGKGFSSSLCVQTGSGAHPASCTMGTGGPYPRGEARPGRDVDHSSQSSTQAKNE